MYDNSSLYSTFSGSQLTLRNRKWTFTFDIFQLKTIQVRHGWYSDASNEKFESRLIWTEIPALIKYKWIFSIARTMLSSSHCRRPHWSLRVPIRCPSDVGSPHCPTPLRMLFLTLPRMLGQATQAGSRHQIRSGSSCSPHLTALSRTDVALFSSLRDDRCQSHRPQSLRNAVGFLPRCPNGFLPHPIRCRTQFAFCGRHLRQNLSRSLFVVCGKYS